jgi:ribonuclease P/MRP protein subunit RPP40
LRRVNSGNHCNRFGAPQGSVVGPLLVLVYVNDIGNSVPAAKVKLFADDTNLFVSHENIGTLNDKVNCDIGLLCQWFVVNKLSLL